MKRQLGSVYVAILFFFVDVASVAFAASGEPTKIGIIIAQTGPIAAIGQGIVNAIALSGEQRDPMHRVKFIYEDDGLQPQRTVSAANKLINEDAVAALVTFTGGPSAALAPIAEARKIPLVTIAAGDQHTVGRQYVYRVFLSTDAQVDLLIEEMRRLTLKRIAVVTTAQESLVRLKNILRERAASQIVANEEVLISDTDMRGLASRIKGKSPDAIVLYLLPPQLSAFSKAIREQGFAGTFFGGIQVYNFPEVRASEGALIGTIFPAPKLDAVTSSFYRDYEAKFKTPLASEQEIYGYDVGALLIEAAKTGDIQGYLASRRNIQGLAGEYPRRPHNFFEVPAVLKRISSNSSVEVLRAKK